MKFGSLFTGVGGFDLGFEHAGFECVWQVEQDAHCLEVLAEHYPEVERYTDVRTVGKHNLNPVDLICGGFPCQDLSVAGKRAGFDGKRSSLWFEFERIIDEMRPKWVVIENVPGLLNSKQGRDFGFILSALDDRGYGVAWRVLDSQNFGVAQRRRRVFVVGSLGTASCAEVLFESESLSGNIAKGGKAGKDVAYTLRANPSHSGDKGDGGINTTLVAATLTPRIGGNGSGCARWDEDKHLMPAPMVMSSGQANAEIMSERRTALTGLHEAPISTLAGGSSKCHSDITSGQQDANVIVQPIVFDEVQITSEANWSKGAVDQTYTLNGAGKMTVIEPRAVGHSGGETLKFNENVNTLNAQTGSETTAMFNGVWQMNHASEVYRDAGDKVPTLQSRMGTGGNNVPLVGVRRLTPTECERLQGFPDGWTASQSDTQRYKQMGNAVTVNVAEWIANRIIKFAKGE